MALLGMIFVTGCGSNTTAAAELTARQVPTPVPMAKAKPIPTAIPSMSPERMAQARDLFTLQGCVGCHTVESYPEARGVVGPKLTHVAEEAVSILASAEYQQGGGEAKTVSEFMRESIISPSKYIATDCPLGECQDFLMPRDFKKRLSAEELDLLVELLTSFE
ncbi:hydroxylamine reductase [Oscillochloris trichoides DG-6]|uniref:Hydroxylamine reductase n=1 Tax=Oscillochloris trichoides DG-6 TaxID=765420 RepID=E1ICC8_9CHLR|nr:hydroxylamine reductase [Oscillochloris trichoides DG-6]